MNNLVCIVMAYFNPDYDTFIKQLESITNQTYKPLMLNIFVDSDKDNLLNLEAVKKYILNHNINIIYNTERKGFRDNFISGVQTTLNLYSPAYIAFSDQDDNWDLDKIEKSINYLIVNKNIDLVHTDSRILKIVKEQSTYISNSLWAHENRNVSNQSFFDVIFRNVATGASIVANSKFIKDNIDLPNYVRYHDHWFAICAAKTNSIGYLNFQTYDYIQHGFNVVGANVKSRTRDIEYFKNHYSYLSSILQYFDVKDSQLFFYLFSSFFRIVLDRKLCKSYFGYIIGKFLMSLSI